MRGCGVADLKFSDYKSLRRFRNLYFLKSQCTPSASGGDIPPGEKNTSRGDQTDTRGEKLKCSQHSFKRLCHEKEQITLHASSGDIPPREKNTSRGDKTDTRDERLKCSKHSFKGLYREKKQITSHASKADISPKETMHLKDDQEDLRDRGPETSQHSGSGKELKPTDSMPKKISDDDLEFSDISSLRHFKSLCLREDQFTSHESTRDLPPKERNDIWHIEIDAIAGDLVISEETNSKKERKSSAELPRRRTGSDNEESSGDSNLPHLKHLRRQKDQLTSHVSSKDFPPKKRKNFGDIQRNIKDGEVETPQYSAARKKLKLSAEVPKTRTADPGLGSSDSSTCPHFKCLSFKKGNFISHASSGHIPHKEDKPSRDTQTHKRDEGSGSSKMIKFVGAPADVLDVDTEASGPLSPNEQQVALIADSHTTKHSNRHSCQKDVGNTPAHKEKPILKVSEDEQKARDEDISFFESLLSHTKRLSSARKMLLRINIQKLIYHFVYHQEFKIQQ
jgi:hypothetical protein